MARTRGRPFVSGALAHGPLWLWVIGALTIFYSVMTVSLLPSSLRGKT